MPARPKNQNRRRRRQSRRLASVTENLHSEGERHLDSSSRRSTTNVGDDNVHVFLSRDDGFDRFRSISNSFSIGVVFGPDLTVDAQSVQSPRETSAGDEHSSSISWLRFPRRSIPSSLSIHQFWRVLLDTTSLRHPLHSQTSVADSSIESRKRKHRTYLSNKSTRTVNVRDKDVHIPLKEKSRSEYSSLDAVRFRLLIRISSSSRTSDPSENECELGRLLGNDDLSIASLAREEKGGSTKRTLNREPAATKSTTAADRPARLNAERNGAAF